VHALHVAVFALQHNIGFGSIGCAGASPCSHPFTLWFLESLQNVSTVVPAEHALHVAVFALQHNVVSFCGSHMGPLPPFNFKHWPSLDDKYSPLHPFAALPNQASIIFIPGESSPPSIIAPADRMEPPGSITLSLLLNSSGKHSAFNETQLLSHVFTG
jgi:hypothetical protein